MCAVGMFVCLCIDHIYTFIQTVILSGTSAYCNEQLRISALSLFVHMYVSHKVMSLISATSVNCMTEFCLFQPVLFGEICIMFVLFVSHCGHDMFTLTV